MNAEEIKRAASGLLPIIAHIPAVGVAAMADTDAVGIEYERITQIHYDVDEKGQFVLSKVTLKDKHCDSYIEVSPHLISIKSI